MFGICDHVILVVGTSRIMMIGKLCSKTYVWNFYSYWVLNTFGLELPCKSSISCCCFLYVLNHRNKTEFIYVCWYRWSREIIKYSIYLFILPFYTYIPMCVTHTHTYAYTYTLTQRKHMHNSLHSCASNCTQVSKHKHMHIYKILTDLWIDIIWWNKSIMSQYLSIYLSFYQTLAGM